MKIFRKKEAMAISLVVCAFLWKNASATFYPTQGSLYYNGGYYMNDMFLWGVPVWSVANPGYEHDLWIHNPRFFTSTCTTMTNLPDGYDDCPTAGIADPSGPVFSFGTYSANRINANHWYIGAWSWTSHDSSMAQTSFTLQGQENTNICGGVKSIWCMNATQTSNLISGYYMNWGVYPSIIVF